MSRIINLTPHEVNIFVKGQRALVLPASNDPVRLSEKIEQVGEINGIPLYRVQYVLDRPLPERQPDTFYVVSRLVKDHAPDRDDFIVPFQLERALNGAVIGSKSFAL